MQVAGLKDGAYKLFIENVFIGTFSSQELGTGVNLALKVNTPQHKRSRAISELCAAYRKTEFQLRTIAFINHSYLNDYNGSNDVQHVKKHLDSKLKKIEGKPFYGYIKKNVQSYFETLPKIDSLENSILTLHKELYPSNKQMLNWLLVAEN